MQVTAALIKDRLLSNLESVLSHLFPNGKIKGHEFRVGSVDGEAGSSLAVELRGNDRGAWQDFAFGNDPENRGDVIKLWCRAKNQTFKEAFPEMKRFCGFSNVEPIHRKPKPQPTKAGISKLTKEVHAYLSNRGISDDTLKKYRIRSHRRRIDLRDPRSEESSNFMLFPFIDSDGDPVMVKSTGITLFDGKKNIWTSPPYYTLFGWWLVGDNDREIIVCEGEIDAMSLYQMNPGIPVLSLPSGVSNMDWIENDWEALQRFSKIYLVFDHDQPHPKTGLLAGEEGAREAAKRLGPARCMRIPIPGDLKDVNEVLLSGDERFVDWNTAWLPSGYTFDPPTIGGIEDYRSRAMARLIKQRQSAKENTFIWGSIPFQFRNSETTVISGYPHGGKSAWLYLTHTHEILNGEKWFMVSFEIEPEDMIVAVAHILMGREPTNSEFERVMDWLCGKLYFFRRNKREKTTLAELLADLDYSVQRFGCTRIAVDSLHFLARKEDYEGQDNVSLQLTNFSKSRDVHVALVCHSVIKKGEDIIPGMGMVEGSGGITKPIDNGVTIWRNPAKNEAIMKARDEANEANLKAAERLHDGIMKIWKNRETGKLTMAKLWFDGGGKSFRLQYSGDVYAPLAKEMADPQPRTDLFQGDSS